MKPARRARRKPNAPASPAAPPANAFPDTISTLVFATLAAVLLARVAATFAPGAWWWGLDFARTLGPAWAFTPWIAAALALAPPIARPLAGLLDRRIGAPGLGTAALLSAALVWLIWTFPDRLQFVGDALLRLGTIGATESAERLFPQAFPLDLALHVTLPRLMLDSLPLTAIGTARVLGTLEALAFTACAIAFARTIGARGAVGVGTVVVVVFGGVLALFTGYLKAFVELAVLAVLIGTLAVRVARDGRSRAAFGIALAVALLLHRSAVALLPGALVVGVLDMRRHPGAWRRPAAWIGVLAVAIALALDRGQMAAVGSFDMTRHILPAEVRGPGGPLAAAFAPSHLLEVANLLLLLVPILPLLPVLLAARAPGERSSLIALAALALGPLALALFVRPQQGLFRDWDVFAMTGVTLSLVLVVLLRDVLASARGRAWLALPALVVSCTPTLQHMALQNSTRHGLERVAHVLAGPPTRSVDERSRGFDYVGTVALTDGDADLAVRAFRSSIDAAPNPRLFVQWGMAEATRGDDAKAVELYQRALALSPNLLAGWKGLAASASRLGRWDEVMRAGVQLRELAPNDPATAEAIRAWESRRPANISLFQQ